MKTKEEIEKMIESDRKEFLDYVIKTGSQNVDREVLAKYKYWFEALSWVLDFLALYTWI